MEEDEIRIPRVQGCGYCAAWYWALKYERLTPCPAQELVNALQGSENVALSCGLLPGQEALRFCSKSTIPPVEFRCHAMCETSP